MRYLNSVDRLLEAGTAGAALHIVDDHALRVGPAGVGLARFDRLHAGDGGRIALESGQTEADRLAADLAAASVGAARVGPTGWPVGDAAHERVAGLAARTRADGVAVVHLAEGVAAAWRGLAGVGGREDNQAAANIRITRET